MEVKVDNSFGKKDFPETKIIIDSFCISVRESENRIFIQIMAGHHLGHASILNAWIR